MRAEAHVAVEADGSHLRYRTLRSDPPLLLRPTPDALYLVGGSAGPLGGDAFTLTVQVDPNAHLTVRSAAATCLLPRQDRPSTLEINVRVGENASLDWNPEPTISVAGSKHEQRTTVELAATAELRWTERIVLGRWNESPGQMTSSTRVERDGRPLTHQDLCVDEFATARTILGDADEVESTLLVGSSIRGEWPPARAADAVTFTLADDTLLHQRLSRRDRRIHGDASPEALGASVGSAPRPTR